MSHPLRTTWYVTTLFLPTPFRPPKSTHSHHPLITVILFSAVLIKTLRLSLFSIRSFLRVPQVDAHWLHQAACAHETSRSYRFKQNFAGGCLPNFPSFNLSPSRSVVSCSNLVSLCIAICDLSLCRVLFSAAICHLQRTRPPA